MASQGRTILKSFFQTGDRPTEAQFADLIDSMFNLEDDDNSDISGSSGVEVTNASDRTALRTGTNFVNPSSAGDTYYPIMTLNAPSGYGEHDYFIGYDTVNTTTLYKYTYLKVSGTLTWIRIPIAFSIPNS